MSKLVLFDGNAIMHRAYHAIPSTLTDLHNEPINAVYGLVSMLLRVIQDTKPSHIIFAFDRPEPTFRKKLLEEYQAQRPDMDDELSSQFPKAVKVIKAMGIPVYDKAGFEADDIIGTIATDATATVIPAKAGIQKNRIRIKSGMTDKEIDEVLIVTGDRDMLQLIDKKVKLYMPGRSLSDAKTYGKRETIEKMGVPPEQIIDLKALIGDPSDNYKGVPGVGPKTAEKLLLKYKTLENIYKHIDEIKGRQKQLLIENKDSAYLSQKLATIVRDVDFKYDLKKAKNWDLYSEEAQKAYDLMSFNTLKKRIKKISEELQQDKQGNLF